MGQKVPAGKGSEFSVELVRFSKNYRSECFFRIDSLTC